MLEDFCLLALGCAEDGHERQEVVWRRHGVGCLRELLEVYDSVIVALLHSLEDRIVEAEVLGRAMRVFPVGLAQVVHDIAGTQDDKALIAQGAELLSDLIGVLGILEAIHGELDRRDVCLRQHVMERRPDAVVDAPGIVDSDIIAQKLEHALGELLRARGTVVDCVELRREPVHVVYLAGCRV